MRLRVFGFLLFFASVVAHGQDILNDQKYKEGIYLSFEEFRANSPSMSREFYLSPKNNGFNYELILTDTTVSRKFKRKEIWGVCTGEVVYINSSNYQNKYFTRLDEIGRYCVFKDQVPLNQKSNGAYSAGAIGGVAGGLIFGAVGSIPTEAAVVLNMNNGNFYLLNPRLMELILESEPSLLESYQNEKKYKDEDVMVEYISKYNTLNKDEYNSPTKPSYFSLVIYRRDKKESENPVSILVNDSLITKLSVNDFIEFEIEAQEKVEICANEECANFFLDAHPRVQNYLECGESVKSGAYIEKVTTEHGGFYLDKIKYYKEKRNSNP